MLIQKIIQELQNIPEEKLAEIYHLIHDFRLGLDKERLPIAANPLQTFPLAGMVLQYDDPFGSATAPEDGDVLRR